MNDEGKMVEANLGNVQRPSHQDPWMVDEGILRIIARATRWLTIEEAAQAMATVNRLRNGMLREEQRHMQAEELAGAQQRRPSYEEILAQGRRWGPAGQEQGRKP